MATTTLKGIPINTLPEAEGLDPSDQIIAYREDDGKAYRTKASIVLQMHVFCTQAEYDALPDTKYTDGVVYFIAEGGVIRNGVVYASYILIDTFTISNVSIDANSTISLTVDASKSGYKPLGIVQWRFRNSDDGGRLQSWIVVNHIWTSESTFYITLRNLYSSGDPALIDVTFTFLYKKGE